MQGGGPDERVRQDEAHALADLAQQMVLVAGRQWLPGADGGDPDCRPQVPDDSRDQRERRPECGRELTAEGGAGPRPGPGRRRMRSLQAPAGSPISR